MSASIKSLIGKIKTKCKLKIISSKKKEEHISILQKWQRLKPEVFATPGLIETKFKKPKKKALKTKVVEDASRLEMSEIEEDDQEYENSNRDLSQRIIMKK